MRWLSNSFKVKICSLLPVNKRQSSTFSERKLAGLSTQCEVALSHEKSPDEEEVMEFCVLGSYNR